MDSNLEEELVQLLNCEQSPQQLSALFRTGAENPIDLDLARKIIETRNALPRRRFRSLDHVISKVGLHGETVRRLLEVIRTWPWNDHPVLLLPIRLETRFLGNDLWVRMYPDQVFVDTHDKRLTQEELDAGLRYLDQTKTSSSTDGNSELDRRSAWRGLAQLFGPERAAWIANMG